MRVNLNIIIEDHMKGKLLVSNDTEGTVFTVVFDK